MSNKIIQPDQLAATIQKYIEDYGDEALDVVVEATEKYTTKAVKEVKQKSPKDTGAYKKGWTKEIAKGRNDVTGYVYNKTRYQLAHLLEFGHLKRDGEHRVDGIEHISPVNDSICDEFEKEILSKL